MDICFEHGQTKRLIDNLVFFKEGKITITKRMVSLIKGTNKQKPLLYKERGHGKLNLKSTGGYTWTMLILLKHKLKKQFNKSYSYTIE